MAVPASLLFSCLLLTCSIFSRAWREKMGVTGLEANSLPCKDLGVSEANQSETEAPQELAENPPDKTGTVPGQEKGGPEIGSCPPDVHKSPLTGLLRLISAWPGLAEDVRAAILMLVDFAAKGDSGGRS